MIINIPILDSFIYSKYVWLCCKFFKQLLWPKFFCNMIKLIVKCLNRASNSFWQSFNKLKSTFNTHCNFLKKLFTSYKIGIIFTDNSSCVNILTKKEGLIIYYQNITFTNMSWYMKVFRVPLSKQKTHILWARYEMLIYFKCLLSWWDWRWFNNSQLN